MTEKPAPHPARRQIWLLLAIGFTALGIAGYAGWHLSSDATPAFHGTAYPDAPPAPDFALVDQNGAPATLADHSGTALLLFFGFTECPDVCPVTLSMLSRILEEEGIGPEEARVLLITVDPVNDTPERLAAYVSRYGRNVSGLTGDPAEVERVLAAYGVFARLTTGHDGHESLAHTTLVFGIDRSGRLRVLMHPEDGDEVIGADIEELLRIGE